MQKTKNVFFLPFFNEQWDKLIYGNAFTATLNMQEKIHLQKYLSGCRVEWTARLKYISLVSVPWLSLWLTQVLLKIRLKVSIVESKATQNFKRTEWYFKHTPDILTNAQKT